MPVEMNPSSGWLGGPFECPRQQLVNPALLVAIYDGVECGGQVGQRIDRIELAGLCRPSNYAECLFYCLQQTVRSRPVRRVAVVWHSA